MEISKEENEIKAVQQNGMDLRFVENQTPEICMVAVKQNSDALQYVRDQTPEICMVAVKRITTKL